MDRLPAAAVLDRSAYKMHAFAYPIWTFAVIAGAIWAQEAWGRYWGWDPKETWSFITWVIFAVWLDTLRDPIAQHADLLRGKVVVDPSNPVAQDPNGGPARTLTAEQLEVAVLDRQRPRRSFRRIASRPRRS